MKIRIKTAGGETLWVFDVLEAIAAREETARAAGAQVRAVEPGRVVQIEAISTEPGAYICASDERDGRGVALREFMVRPNV